MTREELRKKRQEIAKNNGYTDYKGKSQNQPVNQQPVEPKVSTWDKVMNIAKSMGTDVANIGKNFGLGVSSAVKNSGYYIQGMTENKFGDYRRYNQQQSALMKKEEETEKLTKDKGTVNINDVKLPENPNQRQMVSEEETKKALLPQKQESRVLKSIDESIAKDEEKIQQNIDNSSNRVSKKLAELMPSIAQSVTGMGASVVNPALGLGFWQTSAGGGYTREAEKNGYTGNQAMLYGTIMGSMESATEWIGAKLTTGVGKAFFKSGAVEGLKALGLDIAENFFEEAIMEPIQETVKQAIGKDGDWQDIGKRMLQSGINGALTSIIMGGASAGIGSATNLITKAQNGGQITQKEIADTLKEINKSEEVDIEKILANNFKFTAEDLAINTDAQQRTEQKLEGVAETLTRNEAQQLLINNSDLDETQKEVLSEIANQYNLSDEDVKKAIQNTKDGKYNNLEQIEGTTTQNNEVLNQEQQTIQDENKMAQNETSQEQRDLIQDLQKFNETRQEGQEIFDLDNEENVKEVQAIQKLAKNRNINITFDESRFDNTDTNAFYEYDKDGNVANIVLNPNSTSKKYVQNLVIHEMTHSFEGSKQYKSLSKAILDYAKSKGEYKNAFNDLMNTYSKVYSGENLNKIVEKEAVANILGEKLGDKEFVDSLVNNQYVERSTIQKIIDFVKNQINRFKGYKDQEAYWNHVKTLFEDAYNKSEVSQEGIKASVERNKLTDIRDSQGRQLSKGQQEYFKDSKVRDENGNLLEVYHGTKTEGINIFEYNPNRQTGTDYGKAYYFTSDYTKAQGYQYDIENDPLYKEYDKKDKEYKNWVFEEGISEDERSNRIKEWSKWHEENNVFDILNNEEFTPERMPKGETKKVYLNLTNPYIADANGEYYSKVYDKYFKEARKNGNDGIIVKNVIDVARGEHRPIDVYIAFNENQIKNIDNLNPTENPDIRYSKETSTTDNQGNKINLPSNLDYSSNKNLTSDIFKDYNVDKIIGKNLRSDDSDAMLDKMTEYSKRGTKLAEKHGHYSLDYNDIGVRSQIENGILSTGIYDIDNNFVVLTTTKEGDKLFIDELYVENQNQGTGTKVVNALKEYADKAGLELIPHKELSTAKGFWDKVLGRNTETSTKDSQGRELSKGQQDYFNGSKAVDKNGNLVNVFHTTGGYTSIPQFNEFDPRGDSHYKFGNQIVNYYTDDKDMSGSYANQEYNMADTRKVNNIDEANKYLNSIGDYTVEEIGDGIAVFNNTDGEAFEKAKDFAETLTDREKSFLRDMLNTGSYELFVDENPSIDTQFYEDTYKLYEKFLNNNKLLTEYAHKYSKPLQSFLSDYLNGKGFQPSKTYDTTLDFLKSVRGDFSKGNDFKNYGAWQYSGYVNIQNPYVIDAEGRNWNTSSYKWLEEYGNEETNYLNNTLKNIDKISNNVIQDIKELYNNKNDVSSFIEDLYDYFQDLQDKETQKAIDDVSYLLESGGFDNFDELIVETLGNGMDLKQSLKSMLIKTHATRLTTNDIVKQVIEYNNSLFGEDNSEIANEYGISKEQTYKNRTPEEILAVGGYDGIIIRNVTDYGGDSKNVAPHDLYITFASNQFKAQDNKNPTYDKDIRYSKDTSGAWNNFIEKYFKNEGTGTAIKDLKKLPTREYTTQDFKEVLDNAKNIPQEEKTSMMKEFEGQKLTKEMLNDWKTTVKQLDNSYETINKEQEQQRFEKKNYEDEGRAELISNKRKEFNTNMEYDDSVVAELDEIIPRNRNGKRTVAEWKNMAKQLGQRIANLSPEQIEDIAVKSYYDLEPTKAITRYDNRSKTNVGYEQLYANDWVNEVYEGVRENRQFSVETENQENIEQPTQEVELPKAKKILNPTEISNLTPEDASTTPELPNKKYKEGTKVSNFVSNIENDVGFLNNEEKQELLKDDNVKFYAEVTNADTLAKAYDNLKENGRNATIEWYAKPTENATAEDVATGWVLLKQYSDKGDTQGMVNVAKKLRDMGTKAGQTVQAFNILSRLTPEGMVAYTQGELQDAYNEMIKGKSKKWIEQHKSDFDLSQDEVAFIMDTMQNLPEENPANNNYDRKVALGQIQKLFTDKIPSENNKIKAWMRISMLFNPKTQVRNVAGNAIVVPVNMTSDFLGSKVDKLLSKYTGVRTLGNANVKAYLEGMKEGFYESYNDFRLGINTRDIQQNKFEFGQGKAFKDKGIGKALNRVDNLLNFVMDFGDRGFSQASFTNSLNNQMLLNGVTTPTQEMIDIATEESLSRTWNDDNEYTKFVLGVRRALNKVGTKNYGLGDVLIPFAKTPANLTKAIVEYSPVGLTKSLLDIPNIKNAIETGQMTAQQQHQFADHLGKGMAGTLLYIAGYALAKAGIATGEPEEDKDVKNFMKNSLGIGSYSIKVGDKSFAYDWAQPVATPLAIMTNLYQTNKNNPDASLLDKTLSAVNIGTNQLLEQSFMESLNEVLNGNGEITDRIQKAILDLPARAIPTFSKQIADMVDGTQRTSFEYGQPVQSAINSAKAKLPFVSKSLTPVVDTLGNEVQKYGGENNWFNVFFNPANMNKGEKTKAGEEIYKVYEETGDTTIFPVTAPYYVNYDGSKITMDSKQRAEYQKTAGDYTEQTVNDLINDKDYQKLDDTEKAEILSKVVTDSNEKAKRDVLNIDKNSSDLDLIDQVGSDYYTYKLSEKGKTKQPEKCEVLLNKDYSNKNKQLIYSNEINKDDKTYNGLLQINKNLNMNDYLKFKAQTFEGENKKKDMTSYLENSNLSREEQLYILGKNYKLNASQKQELENLLRNKMPSNDIISVLESIK